MMLPPRYRLSRLWLPLLVMICSGFVPALGQAELRQPNIIFIVTDDIGWTDFQSYHPAGKIPTPTISRLASEGMRFTDAHSTSSLCSPSRYSLLTGNYPWRGRQPGGTWSWSKPSQILPGQQTIGDWMQKAGYRTAFLGKLHQGGDFEKTLLRKIDFSKPMTFGPEQWGFDYSYVLLGGHQGPPYAYFENNSLAGKPAQMQNLKTGPMHGGLVETAGVGLPNWDSSQTTPKLLEKAITFIRENPDKPFYLQLNPDSAHPPFTPPATIMGTPVAGVTGISAHADMIYGLDVMVSKLMETLAQQNQLDNTLIVITSDNGGNEIDMDKGHDPNIGLRSSKSFIWEGGHRVPLIAWWKNTIPAGTVRHQLIGIHDMLPTFVDLADGKIPSTQCLDGISFAKILRGKKDDSSPVREFLLIDSGMGRDAFAGANQKISPNAVQREKQRQMWAERAKKGKNSTSDGMARALRQGPWKLVFDIEFDKPVALYNLQSDLGENHNIITMPEHKKRVASMEKEYREIRASERSTKRPLTGWTLF